MTHPDHLVANLAAAYRRSLAAEECDSLLQYLTEADEGLIEIDDALLSVADDLYNALLSAPDDWADTRDLNGIDLYPYWHAGLLSAEPVRSDDGLSRRVVAA